LDQHEQIIQLIQAKKPEEAAKAMTDHLNRAKSIYRIEKRTNDKKP